MDTPKTRSHSPILYQPPISHNRMSNVWVTLNILSSLLIVLANKTLFQTYEFQFGTTLTTLHFITTAIFLEVYASMGGFKRKEAPLVKIIGICIMFCAFVVATNLSLVWNSVGFYQMAKVATTPAVMIIQTIFHGIQFSAPSRLTLALTCIGILIASVTDVTVNFVGSLYAVIGIITAAVYQVWIGSKQKELDLSPIQLLHNQAPISALMMVLCIPWMDDLPALKEYQWSGDARTAIFSSCLMALLVNLSQFKVIGNLSAVTYNVVGHFKTCLVLLFGWMFFSAKTSAWQLFGTFIALGGIFSYSYLKISERPD